MTTPTTSSGGSAAKAVAATGNLLIGEGAGGAFEEMRAIAEDYLKPQIITLTEPSTGALVPVVVHGKDLEVTPAAPALFDPYRTKPLRRQGTATLTSVDSFIDHVQRFASAHSVVFANDDRSAPSLTAVLDYHEKGSDGAPAFGKHRTQHLFPLSDEWKAWLDRNATAMSMVDFAMFLEDRVIDVLALIPDEDELTEEQQKFVNATGGTVASPSTLLQLSVGLKVNETSAVKETRNLSSGEAEVAFQSQHETTIAGDIVRVPSVFMIGIPVFRNGPLYRILARLRYRKDAGRLLFFYELWRTDRVFDHAFREACERVRVETDLPLLFGRPE